MPFAYISSILIRAPASPWSAASWYYLGVVLRDPRVIVVHQREVALCEDSSLVSGEPVNRTASAWSCRTPSSSPCAGRAVAPAGA